MILSSLSVLAHYVPKFDIKLILHCLFVEVKNTSVVTRPPVEDCGKVKKLNGRIEMSHTSKGWGFRVWGWDFCLLYEFQMQTDGVHMVANTTELRRNSDLRICL